ncbi:dksA/traR C4-type zinc finger [Streptomyces sp. WMMB 714]|uniref:TraR/DksA family transcriptional regulator n=1 Tax=Streptomyces sp. WMMB 714 TaxID=1286822 RepID=UPI0005F7772F|nr:TraR/DksA C4-type zinc finger protein [Streptomyces sp. WMMB 714]SCK19944.1 dksA/traR C4-type zinc finger [Streptomyces sp. WMMB 714]
MNDQVVRNDDAGLSGGDLAALRENLEDQRRFRREQLQQIAEAAKSRHEGEHRPGRNERQHPRGRQDRHGQRDHEGGAREDGDREAHSASVTEVSVKLAASARMVLADVEAALERMAHGQYGSCHRCTGPISLDRLTIVPQARYCARCHRVRETRP